MKDLQIWSSNLNFDVNEDIIKQLHTKVKQYGDFDFSDDIWYCNHKHKDNRNRAYYTIFFEKVNPKYKKLLKCYALLKKGSIASINSELVRIHDFLHYFEEHYPHLNLRDVDKKIISKYEMYLKSTYESILKKNLYYRAIKNFFGIMIDFHFQDMPEFNPTKQRNPFRYKIDKNDGRYIPIEVVRQYDKHMKDETLDIPLELRTAYWIFRSFPNRSQEVFGCKLDALKTSYSYYVLFVPTWKQNGGYDIEEMKSLPLINVGHGAYLIKLLQQLTNLNKNSYQHYETLTDDKRDILFLYRGFSLRKEKGKLVTHYSRQHNRFLAVMSSDKFNKSMKQLANILQIKDKEGNIYAPTSHQFRHNAITDRFYIGGYTEEQVSQLSNHKNTNMLSKYRHPLRDAMKKMLQDKNIIAEKAAVEVKGKYWNLDEKTIALLRKTKPDAYLTWEAGGAKGVGICSQIDKCNPKGTAHHFECYACDWFVPKSEYLEYYKKEFEYWENKMREYADHPKWAASFENAVRNSLLTERIIQICQNGIERHKEELLTKILSGELTGDI